MMERPLKRHELVLDASLASAGEASVWARTLAADHGLAAERVSDIDLCIIELINNIVDHGYAGAPGEIELELMLGNDSAILRVTDEAPPFDPMSQPPPVKPASLDGASIGGYGLHLVRQAADACHYARKNNHNIFTAHFGAAQTLPRLHDRRRGAPVAFPLARADGTVVHEDQRKTPDRRALSFISRCAMFEGVPWAELEEIVAQCQLINHPAGAIVLEPGPHSTAVLVVIQGSLKVHLGGPQSDDAFEIPCGGSVGEISVADSKPVSAWVIAAEPCQLLVISENVFLERLLAIPRIGRNMISQLADRMRRSNQRIMERLHATAELKRLQQELDFAQRIQTSMLPPPPLLEGSADIHCHGFMRAARQVGGDFYDAIRQGPGRYFLAIGDVCNKGMPAALFMARALTILRGLAVDAAADPGAQLAQISRTCNEQLNKSNEAQLFVSLLLVIVDTSSATLHYCNAGHCPPLLQLPNAVPVALEASRNPIAGIVPGLNYTVASNPFPSGSRLSLYTDGITEAEAPDASQFGEERLLEVLNQPHPTLDELAKQLVLLVDAFAQGAPQSDDITFLLAEHTAQA